MNGNNPAKRKRKRGQHEATFLESAQATQLPMGTVTEHILADADIGNSERLSDSGLVVDCRHDESNLDEATRSGGDNASIDNDRDGQMLRDMGDNPGTGCDSNHSGLGPVSTGGQELAHLDTVADTCIDGTSTASDDSGYEGEAEVPTGRGAELLHNVGQSQYDEQRLDMQVPYVVYGMTTEDCIHAMKLLARFMDMSATLSDYPNASMQECKEVLDAFSNEADDIVTYYYQTLDTLEQSGG